MVFGQGVVMVRPEQFAKHASSHPGVGTTESCKSSSGWLQQTSLHHLCRSVGWPTIRAVISAVLLFFPNLFELHVFHLLLTFGHSLKTKDSMSNSNSTSNPNTETKWKPIARLGIVAAASKNRVIGLNGKIPWPRLEQDRKIFKDLTRNKILVLGRRTFEEEPNRCHINHSRHCIVVSKTMAESKNYSEQGLLVMDEDDAVGARYTQTNGSTTQVHVAGSFDEALHLAKGLAENDSTNVSSETMSDMVDISATKKEDDPPAGTDGLQCWIAGGEGIYKEALRHPSAQELHLTIVDTEIDLTPPSTTTSTTLATSLARFPAKYHWDQKFKQVSQQEWPKNQPEGISAPGFTYYVYERKRRQSD
jgi:dihydrofolate reductase